MGSCLCRFSYKFTSYLFGNQRQVTGSISLRGAESGERRAESGCCSAESRLSTSSELLDDEGCCYLVEDSKKVGKTTKCWTVDKTKMNKVTDIGIQCGPAFSEVTG
ncbi:hypothetical protein HOLleu_13795 [Holothuria leucospilota]|uniref:Uncharacterized protein n=1 Tax=Holothuria leucospilota TaxID=206669 RepID=A0A9Q1HBZ8_HOLLE|nr:hypothetical protein HOLleu_13795 [Holothuria leucospilota]